MNLLDDFALYRIGFEVSFGLVDGKDAWNESARHVCPPSAFPIRVLCDIERFTFFFFKVGYRCRINKLNRE